MEIDMEVYYMPDNKVLTLEESNLALDESIKRLNKMGLELISFLEQFIQDHPEEYQNYKGLADKSLDLRLYFEGL